MIFFILLFLIFGIFNIYIFLYIISPYIILQPFRKTKKYYQGNKIPFSPDEIGFSFEEICFDLENDILIKAWFINARNPSGTIIYSHGIGETKSSGLFLLPYFISAGINIVLYDLRAHGESTGNYCTFGFYEKYDLEKIISRILKNTNHNSGFIGLYGTSLGAAVSLQTLEINKNIKFCISEASFSEFHKVFKDYQSRGVFRILAPIRKLVLRRAEKMALFSSKVISPLNSVKSASSPIFFLHGENDYKVDPEYCNQMFDQSPKGSIKMIIPLAGHNNLRDFETKEYFSKIIEFVTRINALPANKN